MGDVEGLTALPENIDFDLHRCHDAYFKHLVLHSAVHEPDLVSSSNFSVYNTEEDNYSSVCVIVTVEYKCSERKGAVCFGGR